MKTKLALLLCFLAALCGSARAQVNNARMLSTPNAQTGTTYTFVPADTTRVTTFANGSPVAVTLPNGATQGFGPGTVLTVVNLGAGAVTITCSSCTINGAATLVISPNLGADIYGGAGNGGAGYVALVTNGGGGGSGIINPGTVGNLSEYSASTAVSDSDIAASSVAQKATDNTWTSNNRFEGPIPWRDITAYMPAGGCDQSANGINQNTSGAMTATSANLTLNVDLHFKNGCGIFVNGAGPTTSLSAPSLSGAVAPVVINGVGSTTVHYKVSAVDSLGGISVASAAITVTTAPATRTATNYVAIYWKYDGAAAHLVWTDVNGGGSYVPLGYSFMCSAFSSGGDCGYIDKGAEAYNFSKNPSFPFFPLTPPTSPSGQALITTIVSGAGTLNLVLANAASNTVGPDAYVYPDARPFVDAALAAAAADGTTENRSNVYIPFGLWYLSGVDFPSNMTGVAVIQTGTLELFQLPILAVGENISWIGQGGSYGQSFLSLSTAQVLAQSQVGAAFVAAGSNPLDLEKITVSTAEDGVIITGGASGPTFKNDNLFVNGTGVGMRIDANTFFGVLDYVAFQSPSTNNQIPAIWYTGLTNSAQSNPWTLCNLTFISHTIRDDNIFGGNGWAAVKFCGGNSVEDNTDGGWLTSANGGPEDFTFSNIDDADADVTQSLIYSYAHSGPNAGSQVTLTGEISGIAHIVGSLVPAGGTVACPGYIVDLANTQTIGKWGHVGSTYSGCDVGLTMLGNDVQTTALVVNGGNYSIGGSPQPMLAHSFRVPIVSGTVGGGSLTAGTYYIQGTVLDVAGRESGASPEIAFTVGASGSIALSLAEPIYFPTSCNFYFGTSSGGENAYFNSTAVTNGTCTFTLTTTSGETSATPPAIGNAWRSWLTEENNANSCLSCGTSNGGTGFIGFNLSPAEYATANSSGGPGVFAHNLTVLGTLTQGSAPTVASGFGSGAAVSDANGYTTFLVNVGTSNTGTGILTLPTSPLGHGWSCRFTDGTTVSPSVFYTHSAPTSTTSVTLQNYTNLGVANSWVDSDVLEGTCAPY